MVCRRRNVLNQGGQVSTGVQQLQGPAGAQQGIAGMGASERVRRRISIQSQDEQVSVGSTTATRPCWCAAGELQRHKCKQNRVGGACEHDG